MERFLESLSRGVFILARCSSCEMFVWPPSDACNRCLSDVEWISIKPKGKIVASSVSHLLGKRLALVELEQGIRLFGTVDGEASEGSHVMLSSCGIDDKNHRPYYVFKPI